jgi:hypothetical protein
MNKESPYHSENSNTGEEESSMTSWIFTVLDQRMWQRSCYDLLVVLGVRRITKIALVEAGSYLGDATIES